MPIPASGPLSMTDIQTEFGGTNPIGLSEYYAGGGLVPPGTTGTFGAVPSSGAISIQNFYGTSNVVYFFATLGLSNNDYGAGAVVDTNGNMYIVGTRDDAGEDFIIAKYNASGVIQWQRKLGAAGGDRAAGISIDSSANIYITGITNASGYTYIAKYNTSGTLQWQRQLQKGALPIGSNGVAVDTSGNAYIVGYEYMSITCCGNNIDVLTAKYDTSGTLQWQKRLGRTGFTGDFGYGVATNSSGDVFFTGQNDVSGSGRGIFIAKRNTSGTLQWQNRFVVGSGKTDEGRAIALDSSSNAYTVGYGTTGTTTDDLLVSKVDSSGTLQWQRRLGDATPQTGLAVALDGSANVYVAGATSLGSTGKILLAKYNSSGTIQWQRTITASTPCQINGLSVSSDGIIYFSGFVGNSPEQTIFSGKLPGDGSKTGTYTVGALSFTYAASSLTDADSGLTYSASSMTDATPTLTDNASSLVSSTSTLTANTTTL